MYRKAFQIRNHPYFDKKVRNTGGVHQSGYFHFLTQNEIQHNESGSESKKFPVQLRSLAAKEGIRAKQEISELESANTFEVPASKFAPQTHLS